MLIFKWLQIILEGGRDPPRIHQGRAGGSGASVAPPRSRIIEALERMESTEGNKFIKQFMGNSIVDIKIMGIE